MDQKPTSIAVFSTAVQQVINGPRKWRDIPDQNLRCDLGPIQQLHHLPQDLKEAAKDQGSVCVQCG